MDDVKPPTPRRFDDIARPGETPANASSKPVIVGNKTVQADPMMSGAQSSTPQGPTIPVVPPQGTQHRSQDIASTSEPQMTASEMPNSTVPSAEPSHNLHHEKAFFGEMKPVKTRAKKFMIFMLVILIAGGICAGAWYLLNGKSATTNNNKNETPVKTAPADTTTDKSKQTVPDGYQQYENADNKFSFVYPKEYDEFVKQSESQTDVASEYTILSYKSSEPKTEYGPGITGAFLLSSYEIENPVIQSRKYGPDIQLKDGKWIVVKVNPSDTAKQKVGDEYLDYNKKVLTPQKNGDLTVYTLISIDEGSYNTQLIFVTNKVLHVLQMPNFADGTYGPTENAKENDKTKYDTLIKNVRDSISVISSN